MVRAIAFLAGLLLVLPGPARAQPYPEGDTLEERQKWAREHPDYKPFDLPLSAEDRAKYVACEDDWGPSCDEMRERYQEKAAAAIGGDKLPDADLSVQQSWARQNADWKPLGVPMSETDRNNYVICLEQPQWEGCAKIKEKYEKKKEEGKEEKGEKDEPGKAAAPKSKGGGASAGARGAGGGEARGEERKPPPPGAGAAARARADGARAMSRARGLGDALKKGLREGDGGVPGGGGGLSGAATRSGAPAASAGADGGGAGAAAPGSESSSEPAALLRRPDFFSVLPRVRLEGLKTDYRDRPELRSGAFRDIVLSESGRDFERSASCEGLSGACAPDAKSSYRKGDLVPPEELAAIHRRLHGDPDEDFIDEGPGDEWEAEAAAAGAAAFEGAAAGAGPPSRGRAVLRAIERLAGGGEAPKDNTGGPGASKAARLAWGEIPGAAIQAIERGRGRMSAAGAVLLLLAAALLARRAT